jgi:hypothetical protein
MVETETQSKDPNTDLEQAADKFEQGIDAVVEEHGDGLIGDDSDHERVGEAALAYQEVSSEQMSRLAHAAKTEILRLLEESKKNSSEQTFQQRVEEVIRENDEAIVVIDASKHLEALRALGIHTDKRGIFQNQHDIEFHKQFYADWLKRKDGQAVKRDDEPDSSYQQSLEQQVPGNKTTVLVQEAQKELEGIDANQVGIFLEPNADNETRTHMYMHALQHIEGFDTGDIDPDQLDYRNIWALREIQLSEIDEILAIKKRME